MSKKSQQKLVPTSPDQITPSWLSEVLDLKISPKDFSLVTNVQAGSGFMSNVMRVTCKSEQDPKNPLKLIIKILPTDESTNALVVSEKFDKTEIKYYQQIVPKLVEIVPELKPYFCHFYYGDVQEAAEGVPYASVVILEDLNPKGYFTITFADDESPSQLQGVVHFLAKFHYAGMALEKQLKTPLSKVYDFMQGTELLPDNSMIFEMARTGFAEVERILSTQPKIGQNVHTSYQKLAPFSDKMVKMIEQASKKFPCLTHGDLCSYNVLFNNDPKFQTKAIDWQLLGYMDPTYDLAVTIVSSLPKENLTPKSVDELLQLYIQTFKEQCQSKGDLMARDWDAFSKHFYTWGMAYIFEWFLLTSKPFLNNVPKLARIYEFLAEDMKVPEFLLRELESF